MTIGYSERGLCGVWYGITGASGESMDLYGSSGRVAARPGRHKKARLRHPRLQFLRQTHRRGEVLTEWGKRRLALIMSVARGSLGSSKGGHVLPLSLTPSEWPTDCTDCCIPYTTTESVR